jgi:hypothetical protein
MKGENPENWRNALYYHYYEGTNGAHKVRRHYGIRTQRYTLAHFYNEDEWELFDLKKDPEQLKSVYGDSDYAEVQKKLKKKLNSLQEKYGDTNPQESRGDIKERLQKNLIKKQEDQVKKAVQSVKFEQVLHLKDGSQEPPQDLDPSQKPITVGAHISTSSPDGAIISRGGKSYGYMLYIKDRKPAFAVRTNEIMKTVVADEQIELNKPVHIVGVLDKEGRLHIVRDGEFLASAEGHHILKNPYDDLTVGADGGVSRVGTQSGKMPFKGTIRDLRLYWGVMKPQQIKEWSSSGSQ